MISRYLQHCLASGQGLEAVKYLEKAVECFIKAGEKVNAAKISEEVVRLTLSQDFTDSDVIEKVIVN